MQGRDRAKAWEKWHKGTRGPLVKEGKDEHVRWSRRVRPGCSVWTLRVLRNPRVSRKRSMVTFTSWGLME